MFMRRSEVDYATNDFSVGDRVRFVRGSAGPAAALEKPGTEGEIVGINPAVATVDVKVVVRGRPSYLTKRPWDLERVPARRLP
jgi:hypothetical protein